MKNIFIGLFLLAFNQSFSQTYHPMLVEGRRWINMYHDLSICQAYIGYEISIGGDTVVQGTTYKKMQYCTIVSLCQCPYYCTPYAVNLNNCSVGNMLLREDSLQQKVYQYSLIDSTETLAYDFDVQPGDTLTICGDPVEITAINNVVLDNGEVRREFQTNQLRYIESLGGTSGLLHSLLISVSGGWTSLECVRDSNSLLYGYCWGTLGSEELSRESDEINVRVLSETSTSIEIILKKKLLPAELFIYSPDGKILSSDAILQTEYDKHLTTYPPGIYMYEVRCKEGIQKVGKVFIK